MRAEITYPPWLSDQCKDVIGSLLVSKPEKRLGCGKTGIEELKNHAWFMECDFMEIFEKKNVAP